MIIGLKHFDEIALKPSDKDALEHILEIVDSVLDDKQKTLILDKLKHLLFSNKQNQSNPYHSIKHHAYVLAFSLRLYQLHCKKYHIDVTDKTYQAKTHFFELMIACLIHDYDYGSEVNKKAADAYSGFAEEQSFIDAMKCLNDSDIEHFSKAVVETLVQATNINVRKARKNELNRNKKENAICFEIKHDIKVMNLSLAASIISDADMAPSAYISGGFNVHTKLIENELGVAFTKEQKIDFLENIAGLPLTGVLDNDALLNYATLRKHFD